MRASLSQSTGFQTSFRHRLLCPLRNISLKFNHIDTAIWSFLLVFPGHPIEIISIPSSPYLRGKNSYSRFRVKHFCRALDWLRQFWIMFIRFSVAGGHSSLLTFKPEQEPIPIWVLNHNEETGPFSEFQCLHYLWLPINPFFFHLPGQPSRGSDAKLGNVFFQE